MAIFGGIVLLLISLWRPSAASYPAPQAPTFPLTVCPSVASDPLPTTGHEQDKRGVSGWLVALSRRSGADWHWGYLSVGS